MGFLFLINKVNIYKYNLHYTWRSDNYCPHQQCVFIYVSGINIYEFC